MGCRSWEKWIPEPYFRGSPEQRLALLQGLLDTDGGPIDKGGVEFSSTSERLADGVVALALSLSGVARKKGPRITRHQGGEGRPSWRVNVKLPSNLDPFRLKRKLDKWVRPSKYPPLRQIKRIEKEDQREESVCISVAAPDSLYVTRNYIVTHNTIITLTSIVQLQDTGWLGPVLVVGTKTVIETVWMQQAMEWSHTKHLRFSCLTGTPGNRAYKLRKQADVYLINYELVPWLTEILVRDYVGRGRELPFNGVVWDEVSKMKDAASNRTEAAVKWLPYMRWRTGLTGDTGG